MDSILIIDDEKNIRALLTRVLSQERWDIHTAGTGAEGLRLADEVDPDVVLLDLRLPDMGGQEVLKTLKHRHPSTAIIMITAFGQIESAVEAMKNGATDYLEKPFEPLDKLRLSVARALEEVKARREIHRLIQREERQYRVDQLVGESESTRRLREVIRQVARSEAHTVLILGESGTGKELVAKGLHYEGPRRESPFMEVNCAAITETLFESELFGHERGAFTDAKSTKKGLLELADRGTLLLDEVSEMAPGSQAKLLRCLQERIFKRVGGTRDIRVDVRVIAASNRPLEALVKEGRFREDLFYRLNVIPIALAPLRERREDIIPLARYFLAEANRTFHKVIKGFAPETERLLLGYAWPGNVRELKNLVERLVILATSDVIGPEELPLPFMGGTSDPLASGLPAVPTAGTPSPPVSTGDDLRPLDEVEHAHIVRVIDRVHGNKSKAAKILGISRQTLRKKLGEA